MVEYRQLERWGCAQFPYRGREIQRQWALLGPELSHRQRGVFSDTTIIFNKRGEPNGNDLTYIIETSLTLLDPWVSVVTHGPAQLGSRISYDLAPAPDGIIAENRYIRPPNIQQFPIATFPYAHRYPSTL